MPSVNLKSDTAILAALGCGLAAGWYGATSILLPGVAGGIVPVAGAIAIAGFLPVIFQTRKSGQETNSAPGSRISMLKQLRALDTHAGINIVDSDSILTEVNDHLLELTGYSREELIGQHVKMLYDEAAQPLAEVIRSNLERGCTWQGETQLRRKDGGMLVTQATIIPLYDNDGNWTGSISARTDVTETSTLLAERHSAQTLNELRDDIWIIDAQTEKFSYLNGSAKTRLELLDEDYRNKSLAEFERSDEIEAVLQACRTLHENGEVMTQFESELVGTPMYVSIKFLPGPRGAGRYLIVFNDISYRLEQEQRKSAFISTVSHELRSPLTSIKGAMGLLLSRSAGDLPDKALALLEIAHRNADRLILIINDILDLDKISNGQMDFEIQEVDLVELLKEADSANAMLQQRFGVEVTMSGADEPVIISTDPNRFIQVLTNLMSNAYKFSPPNGRIILDISDVGQHIRISVQDEGAGIPPSEQGKIFDRFADMTNSDRAAKGGTGLGLSICKAIVESLGGTIGFDTEEDVGTTFYFNLPKAVPNFNAVDEVEVEAEVKRIA